MANQAFTDAMSELIHETITKPLIAEYVRKITPSMLELIVKGQNPRVFLQGTPPPPPPPPGPRLIREGVIIYQRREAEISPKGRAKSLFARWFRQAHNTDREV